MDFRIRRSLTPLQVAIVLLLVFGLTFYTAFIFMKIFNLFVPAFTGWPEINYWVAYGLTLLIGLFKSRVNNKISGDMSDYLAAILSEIVTLAISLGIAELIHLGV